MRKLIDLHTHELFLLADKHGISQRAWGLCEEIALTREGADRFAVPDPDDPDEPDRVLSVPALLSKIDGRLEVFDTHLKKNPRGPCVGQRPSGLHRRGHRRRLANLAAVASAFTARLLGPDGPRSLSHAVPEQHFALIHLPLRQRGDADAGDGTKAATTSCSVSPTASTVSTPSSASCDSWSG